MIPESLTALLSQLTLPLLGAWLICASAMKLLYWYSRKIQNYSGVDALWAALFGICGLYWLWVLDAQSARARIIVLMFLIWGTRLTGFLFRRILQHHPKEDSRYAHLRAYWGAREARGFFWFFQAQALSVVVLAMPMLWVALGEGSDPRELRPLEWLGLAVFLVGWLGESLADRQAARFKLDPSNRGKVCRVGLWAYSRHPNYFFESVVWWGFFIYACASPWGWLMIYCPLTILTLLLKYTGIPYSEEQAVRSRGDEYRRYQAEVSRFVPWFPRAASTRNSD